MTNIAHAAPKLHAETGVIVVEDSLGTDGQGQPVVCVLIDQVADLGLDLDDGAIRPAVDQGGVVLQDNVVEQEIRNLPRDLLVGLGTDDGRFPRPKAGQAFVVRCAGGGRCTGRRRPRWLLLLELVLGLVLGLVVLVVLEQLVRLVRLVLLVRLLRLVLLVLLLVLLVLLVLLMLLVLVLGGGSVRRRRRWRRRRCQGRVGSGLERMVWRLGRGVAGRRGLSSGSHHWAAAGTATGLPSPDGGFAPSWPFSGGARRARAAALSVGLLRRSRGWA